MACEVVAYRINATEGWGITPAPATRDWMDASDGKFAYRCLPLVMANQAGWLVTCPRTFKAVWNGGADGGATKLTFLDGEAPDYIRSHFGQGIITFGLPWLFRTTEGWGLWTRGPANLIKDNCVALDGIVETDWAPYTFTMNWKIMRRNAEVYFKKGDPVCQLVPVRLDMFEGARAEFRELDTEPRLLADYVAFKGMKAENQKRAHEQGKGVFAMSYMKGHLPDGREVSEHRKTFSVPEFEGEIERGKP
jgi:hypothetical protein